MKDSNSRFPPTVLGQIEAEDVVIGQGAFISKGVQIKGKSGKAKKVVIGDFAYIGENTKILAPEFYLGDYSKLHQGCFGHGVEPLRIGHNCWIGGGVTLDSMGGLDLANGVGIGAGSQIWTHAQFGDLVEGCRFFSKKYMRIESDVWLVGHCIVSPVKIEEKSMALAGSVVTRNMEANQIYAGVPAKNVSEKIGNQFDFLSSEQKLENLQKLIASFEDHYPKFKGVLQGVVNYPKTLDAKKSYFNVSSRTYTKNLHDAEVQFLKENVPLVKFVPINKPNLF
jgi:acetyltransferase-like isoleucine patch superfamily enzyme